MIFEGAKARGYTIGTPIFVKHGRVATMDIISEALNAKVTVILIGKGLDLQPQRVSVVIWPIKQAI